MLVLFDHGTPRGIARALQGHVVKEPRAQGWDTLSNGELLRAAEEAGFDMLLRTDANLPHQQNLEGRKLAIVILGKNRWSLVRPMTKEIARRRAPRDPEPALWLKSLHADFFPSKRDAAQRRISVFGWNEFLGFSSKSLVKDRKP